MAGLFVLESFDAPRRAASADAPGAEDTVTEEQRLGAFEKGYKAGWDDSAAALAEEHQRLSADFAANLGDLSFTYHEARAHVMKGVEALLKELVAKVLPKAAEEALPAVVWERVSAMMEDAASSPLRILVAPGCRADIEAIFPADPGFPLVIREETTLAEGQVFLRTGDVEQAIEISAALDDIQSALTDFFTAQQEGLRAHG